VWQVINGRATGTSHTANGLPCQDREAYRVVDDANGGEVAIGVICDGAGSAKYSDAGAELVSDALRSMAAAFVSQRGSSELTPDEMRGWVNEIRERVRNRAEAEGEDLREYACTLLYVIACDDATICGQIGDGAIVVQDEAKLKVAIWPDNGEYANQTFFVTQADSHDRLHLAKFGPVTDFVMFSDGLQRIALNEAEKSAHPGFFLPLVAKVRGSEVPDATKEQLIEFLSSERINAKTDDDKSIIVACRVDNA
jgi:hypothetical protein